jgi:tetratricopeptide (TPR) repeat protein
VTFGAALVVVLAQVASSANSAASQQQLAAAREYIVQARSSGDFEVLRLTPRIRSSLLSALELDPGNAEARLYFVTYLLMAPRIVGGSVKAAMAHVDTLERDNRYLAALGRSQLHAHLGDTSRATSELRSLIRQFPESITPYANLLNFLSDSAGHAEAVSLARRLEQSTCCQRLGMYYSARMSLISGNGLAEAEPKMRAYLATQPRIEEPPLAFAHLRLGQILLRLGRREEAMAELETALRLNPRITVARDELRQLKQQSP